MSGCAAYAFDPGRVHKSQIVLWTGYNWSRGATAGGGVVSGRGLKGVDTNPSPLQEKEAKSVGPRCG